MYNIDIEFNGILGLEFRQHQQCVIDLSSKQLITNFKAINVQKVNKINRLLKIFQHPNLFQERFTIQFLFSKIFKLNCSLQTISILNINTCIDIDYNIRNAFFKEQLRIEQLNEEEQELITQLCLDFRDIFYVERDKLTFTNQIKHYVETNIYKILQISANKGEVKTEKSQTKRSFNIQPFLGHPQCWSYRNISILLADKWRVIIDQRKLNEVIIDDNYPLPHIFGLLDQLGKCQYFLALDLASRFH